MDSSCLYLLQLKKKSHGIPMGTNSGIQFGNRYNWSLIHSCVNNIPLQRKLIIFLLSSLWQKWHSFHVPLPFFTGKNVWNVFHVCYLRLCLLISSLQNSLRTSWFGARNIRRNFPFVLVTECVDFTLPTYKKLYTLVCFFLFFSLSSPFKK